MTRKITSIVKSELDPQTRVGSAWGRLHARNTLNVGWYPFNTSDGSALLGEIDVAFLAVYSLGMFFAGHLGDRMDLRIVLTIGMIGTAIFTALFGAGYWLNIHSFYYFLVFQMISGLFQSSGWPSVVAVVGNWFGKSKRGLIMGIWNAHTSIGNISGSLLAAALLKYGWGWSFAIPSFIMALVGLVVFFFLPVSPDVMEIEIDDGEINSDKDTAKEPLLEPGQEVKHKAIGFLEAWRIPGVAPFALCLFFSKLVAYTFLYWLPFYISHTRKSFYSSFKSADIVSFDASASVEILLFFVITEPCIKCSFLTGIRLFQLLAMSTSLMRWLAACQQSSTLEVCWEESLPVTSPIA
jgi:OPA family glycerol-3-phosphate transporter-like MFS transporter 1/2